MEFGFILIRISAKIIRLTDILTILVNGLKVLIKPLLVPEWGTAPLDSAFVGGLARVNILMVSKIDLLRKQPSTSLAFVDLELFMDCIDMSLKTVLRTELLFAIFDVTGELLWNRLILIRFLDSLIFYLKMGGLVDTDEIGMLILLMTTHFWVMR